MIIHNLVVLGEPVIQADFCNTNCQDGTPSSPSSSIHLRPTRRALYPDAAANKIADIQEYLRQRSFQAISRGNQPQTTTLSATVGVVALCAIHQSTRANACCKNRKREHALLCYAPLRYPMYALLLLAADVALLKFTLLNALFTVQGRSQLQQPL